MKKLALFFAAILAFSSAIAQKAPISDPMAPGKIGEVDKKKNAEKKAPKSEINESQLQTHNQYKNKAGNVVHSPSKSMTGAVPNDASAKCRDNSYSFSRIHRGTCSHHGGVAQWL